MSVPDLSARQGLLGLGLDIDKRAEAELKREIAYIELEKQITPQAAQNRINLQHAEVATALTDVYSDVYARNLPVESQKKLLTLVDSIVDKVVSSKSLANK